MNKMTFTDCVNIVGSSVEKYDGIKTYISTSAVDYDFIDISQAEQVTYEDRPSRANLTACAGDILFAKMQSTKKNNNVKCRNGKIYLLHGILCCSSKKGYYKQTLPLSLANR